ncbi:MAG: hypothetical protein HGB21_12655 [Nitrospirae bacterium]|nr:hypothetical protein [Nitrospirota bacterium]NTW67133.1 hypothetical protein [Nitrospirota bacterium]
MEESLAKKREGTSSLEPKSCDFHKKFVANILRPGDTIITFNYDCVLDYSLQMWGSNKWNAHYGYGFNLGPGGKYVAGHDFWQPKVPSPKPETVMLYKLHGSLHFVITGDDDSPHVKLKQRPYTKQAGGGLKFTIIPPEWHKEFDKGAFSTLWAKASEAINRAEYIVFVGYSLPSTDLHSTDLFRTSVRKTELKSLVVVNPDREARKRTGTVL